MRTPLLLFVAVAIIAALTIGRVLILDAHPSAQPPLQADQSPTPNSTQAQTGDQGSSQQRTDLSTWKQYSDTEHHYTLQYVGTLGFDYSTPSVELIYIVIDPKADPIYICAGANSRGWSALELFEGWKRRPPAQKGGEFPCADYPSYARVSGATTTIANRPAYQVESLRGPYRSVCSCVASTKTLLALCLPSEDADKSPKWRDHLNVYNRILASLKISE